MKAVTARPQGFESPPGDPWFYQEWNATAGQVTFILAVAPSEPNSLSFNVNGVEADEGVDFVRSGVTITWQNFAFAFEVGDHVAVRYR